MHKMLGHKSWVFIGQEKLNKTLFLGTDCVFRFVDAGRQSVDVNSIVAQMTLKIRVVCFQTIY